MKKSARVTLQMFFAVALSAMCVGCFPFKKSGGAPFDDSPPDAEYQRAEGQPVSYQDEVATEDDGLDISDFSLSNIDDTVKKAVGLGPNQGLAVQLHRKGLNQYNAAAELRRQGKDAKEAFVEAGGTFKSAAKRWPESALQQDALFMSAESYFFAEHYPEANEQYEILLQNFPNTHHIDRVEAKRFEIARYWLHLQEKDPQTWYTWNLSDERRPRKASFTRAVKVLDLIRSDDPTGRFADDATMAAGNAHFKDGDWTAAANFYEDLRKTFPSSEHQFKAHFLELKCRMNIYDGQNYSVVPLNKAKELLTTIRKQFPHEANKPEHDQALRIAGSEINSKLAEREWGMARYFDRRWEYGSAKYYYRILASDYAETDFGQKAKQRLSELAGKPDKPRQQLGWLVKLFPDPYGPPLVATRPQENEVR